MSKKVLSLILLLIVITIQCDDSFYSLMKRENKLSSEYVENISEELQAQKEFWEYIKDEYSRGSGAIAITPDQVDEINLLFK